MALRYLKFKTLGLLFSLKSCIVAYMTLPKIVVDTCVVESSLRSQLGASYQILKSLHTNLFRFGISVPLYLEYEYGIEELFHTGIIKISEQSQKNCEKREPLHESTLGWLHFQ
jgi:hypothetical protein